MENCGNIGPQAMNDVGTGVILAIPYYGYARQDKRFKPGEPISAKAIGRFIASHCDAMVVLDLHAPAARDACSCGLHQRDARTCRAFAERGQPDFVLSPDKGAIVQASAVAEAIGCGFSYLEKTRIDARTIVHKGRSGRGRQGRGHRRRHDCHRRYDLPCSRCSSRSGRHRRACGLLPRPVHGRSHSPLVELRG